MYITLSQDGLIFLTNFIQSWFFFLALVCLVPIISFSFFEKKNVYSSQRFLPNITTSQILIGLTIWMLIEFSLKFPEIKGFNSDYLFLFIRNYACILGVLILPNYFETTSIQSNKLIGRSNPFKKFIVFGISIFILLGLIFWSFSFFISFRVHLASTTNLNPTRLFNLSLVVVAIPLSEEILFRNYLYSYVREQTGIAKGIFLSSLLFTVLHGFSISSMAVFLGALVMAGLVELTESIIPSLILHSGFNFLLFTGSYWL